MYYGPGLQGQHVSCVHMCKVSQQGHISLISLVYCFSFLIFVAVILSVVSLLLMAVLHLISICGVVSCLLLITLLQHMVHIRWLASDMSICRSCGLPFSLGVLSPGPFSLGLIPRNFMHLMPRMVPIIISGHGWCSWGHSCSANVQMSLLAFALHSSRMWDIVLSWLQVEQNCLFSRFLTFVHASPIIKVWWVILNRNCQTCALMFLLLIFFQIVTIVSFVPLVLSKAALISRMLSSVRCCGLVLDFTRIPLYAVN